MDLENWEKTVEIGRGLESGGVGDGAEYDCSGGERDYATEGPDAARLVAVGIKALGSSEEVTCSVRDIGELYYPAGWIRRSNEHSKLYVSNRHFVDWTLIYFNILLMATVIFMFAVTGLALVRVGWSPSTMIGTVSGSVVLLGAVGAVEVVRWLTARRPDGFVGGSYVPLPFGLGGILSVDDLGNEGPTEAWRAAVVHELAHRFEHVLNEIGDREGQFYRHRGGRFFHDYSGKRYLFGNRWEILSVGYEYLLFGTANMPSKPEAEIDDEHRQFVRGLMEELPEEKPGEFG